ncbi:leucine-rich repeat domain-containing protein [Corallibacter sp.]|uniref:leucine-rich repeat domain-containing protein n=1 Tax=Corallibacter sp. TaxID=2038084 RepID=UPI003AB90F1C
MKNKTLYFINRNILTVISCMVGFYASAQITNIPDANFEQALIDLGYDTVLDGQVLTANINTVTSLDVESKNLTNLTGIEDFTALEFLSVTNNLLTNLNLSQNTNLTELRCVSNELTSINISQNTALERLWVTGNDLTALDVSQNTNLIDLRCANNPFTSLDVSNNPNLEYLVIYWSSLEVLDVSQNINLTHLDCKGSDYLTTLNVKNSTNNLITFFDATNSPNLLCIQVDNAAYSTINWTNIDTTTSFSSYCLAYYSYIPDDNFEQALIDLGYDDVLDDSVLRHNIDTITSLDVSSKDISTLQGIEGFTSLEILACENNSLTILDLQYNLNLETLSCYNNQITDMYIQFCSNLKRLSCYNNQLTSLDLSQHPNIEAVHCFNNQINYIYFGTNNNFLHTLNCYNNQLTVLDLSQKPSITFLRCDNNQLEVIDIKNSTNHNITYFNATSNPSLSCIKVDDVDYSTTNWTNVDATATFSETCSDSYTAIPDVFFESALNNLHLDSLLDGQVLTASIKTVKNLDIENLFIYDLTGIQDFEMLEELSVLNNNLTTLDVSQNTNLRQLFCTNNVLTTLNLGQNSNLENIQCANNQLTDLDVSEITNLEHLGSSNNQLTSLNLKNGNNTNFVTFYAVNNPNLSCVEVDDVTYANANLSYGINGITVFSEDCNPSYTAIPDANFEQALIDLGYDTVIDRQVLTSNISTVTNLNVYAKNISDLTGIQDFSALEELNCAANQLTALDVSQNANLETLYCFQNQLQALDVSNNTQLTYLDCSNNLLTVLDVDQNQYLERLYCTDNDLLVLDVSLNGDLYTLSCYNNNLHGLNVANANNTNFNLFQANNNPDLACIQVDDATYATANWTDIDATASFSDFCYTLIPDPNFEQALMDLGLDNFMDGQVQTSNINGVINLNVSNKNIADLTGIEDFVSLEMLVCSYNTLTQLDLSNNQNLRALHNYANNLSTLDISSNAALTELLISNNQLTSLNITQNTNLSVLEIDSNQLTTLDVSQNNNLEYLSCDSNSLTNLNVTNNPALLTLSIRNNQITLLDLSQNLNLHTLQCENNELQTLDVSALTNLSQLDCSNNQITDLDVSQNTNLMILYGQSNLFTSVNLANGNNTAMLDVNLIANTNLTCIQIDNGFTPPTDGSWQKDTAAFYSYACSTLGIETTNIDTLKMYPNPVEEYLTITSKTPLTLQLYNVQGQFLKTVKVDENTTVDFNGLPSGVYFLKDVNGLANKKIVKY